MYIDRQTNYETLLKFSRLPVTYPFKAINIEIRVSENFNIYILPYVQEVVNHFMK